MVEMGEKNGAKSTEDPGDGRLHQLGVNHAEAQEGQ